MTNSAPSPNSVIKISFIVGAIVVLGLLVWQLAGLWVHLFAGILFATILSSAAAQIERFTPLAPPWSLVLATTLIALLAVAFMLLVGFQISEQFASLVEQLPQYIASVGDQLGMQDLEQRMTRRLEEVSADTGLLGTVTSYASSTIAAITSIVLILIIGIYLAINPQDYLRGFLLLVPSSHTEKIHDTMVNIGFALRQWLGGQLIIMIIVGTMVSVGLWVIGLPSALALGFMAGVAEFIPVLGPILAAAPAILIAFSQGWETLFWVIGLFLVVQQLEGYLITPLVQRKAVHLPPVLTILSIVGFGTLLGLPGIVMAAPLAVTMMVAIERLYVREALGKHVNIPGNKADSDNSTGQQKRP